MHSLRSLLKLAKHTLATNLRLSWLYAQPSYAQDGEDRFIVKFFDGKPPGWYVDVGAHHPYRYSNTYLLYQRGWRGINIDATPGSMRAFERVRPRDINLECAVSDKRITTTYYLFEDSALNTLSASRAREVISSKQSRLIAKQSLTTRTLRSVLRQYLPHDARLDFLTIDVEGVDESILASNDWQRFHPQLVAIEILSDEPIEKLVKLPVARYLRQQGYQLVARLSNTAFFASTT